MSDALTVPMPVVAPHAGGATAVDGGMIGRVLVVDDAAVVRLYYRRILEAEGIEVVEAVDGVDGLEKALGAPFGLCIVDVNMPVMDGFSFVRALRREPFTHAIPALMASTEAEKGDFRAAIEAGANGYLVKPVPQATLLDHVAALLGRSVA